MLKVIYLIDSFTNDVNITLVFDPYNNELMNPKTGESWFFNMDHYRLLLKDVPNIKVIKRTF